MLVANVCLLYWLLPCYSAELKSSPVSSTYLDLDHPLQIFFLPSPTLHTQNIHPNPLQYIHPTLLLSTQPLKHYTRYTHVDSLQLLISCRYFELEGFYVKSVIPVLPSTYPTLLLQHPKHHTLSCPYYHFLTPERTYLQAFMLQSISPRCQGFPRIIVSAFAKFGKNAADSPLPSQQPSQTTRGQHNIAVLLVPEAPLSHHRTLSILGFVRIGSLDTHLSTQ